MIAGLAIPRTIDNEIQLLFNLTLLKAPEREFVEQYLVAVRGGRPPKFPPSLSTPYTTNLLQIITSVFYVTNYMFQARPLSQDSRGKKISRHLKLFFLNLQSRAL
jgi:hypothetical protein